MGVFNLIMAQMPMNLAPAITDYLLRVQLQKDHPQVLNRGTCPACGYPFESGEWMTLLEIGPGPDPYNRALARKGEEFDGWALPIHYGCLTGHPIPPPLSESAMLLQEEDPLLVEASRPADVENMPSGSVQRGGLLLLPGGKNATTKTESGDVNDRPEVPTTETQPD